MASSGPHQRSKFERFYLNLIFLFLPQLWLFLCLPKILENIILSVGERLRAQRPLVWPRLGTLVGKNENSHHSKRENANSELEYIISCILDSRRGDSETELKNLLNCMCRSYDEALALYQECVQQDSQGLFDRKLEGVLSSAPAILDGEYQACLRQAGKIYAMGDGISVQELHRSFHALQISVVLPLRKLLGKPIELQNMRVILTKSPQQSILPASAPWSHLTNALAIVFRTLYPYFHAMFLYFLGLSAQFHQGTVQDPVVSESCALFDLSDCAGIWHPQNVETDGKHLHHACNLVLSNCFRTLKDLLDRLSGEVPLRRLPPESKKPAIRKFNAPSPPSTPRNSSWERFCQFNRRTFNRKLRRLPEA